MPRSLQSRIEPTEQEPVFSAPDEPRSRFMDVGQVPLYGGQNTYQEARK